jgi:N utilization substance protein B
MSVRRENRIAAMQFLYQWGVDSTMPVTEALRLFFESKEQPREYYSFGEELAVGAVEHLEEVDNVIRKYAKNWDFDRIARIDLAILRLAIYEMLHRRDIPPIVSINEAIDLSKDFSIPDAKRFINGILDQFKLTLDRPLRKADI